MKNKEIKLDDKFIKRLVSAYRDLNYCLDVECGDAPNKFEDGHLRYICNTELCEDDWYRCEDVFDHYQLALITVARMLLDLNLSDKQLEKFKITDIKEWKNL